MGTHGIGPFEGDDAADWAAGLVESDTIDSVAEALMSLLLKKDEPPEAPACARAIAAAEIVAALSGRGADDLPEEIRRWAAYRLGTADPELVSAAARAIDAVLIGSELDELWKDTDHYAAWRARLADLSRRLQP
ncbi:MAG TPA: DUF4259 domain-containing protein [Candidatus Polarisedimenticolaceae bacterium]|nr:DUF4259 domain-containing protein [Candidatus Polarisedimenticolaceae bacterium]